MGRLQASLEQAAFSEVLGWVGVWAGSDHSTGSEAESSNVGTPGPGSAGAEGNVEEVMLRGMTGEDCRDS